MVIERRNRPFTDGPGTVGRGKQAFVVFKSGDGPLVDDAIVVGSAKIRLGVGQGPEVRFLGLAGEEIGMLGQILEEGCGARLGGTDDGEVR